MASDKSEKISQQGKLCNKYEEELPKKSKDLQRRFYFWVPSIVVKLWIEALVLRRLNIFHLIQNWLSINVSCSDPRNFVSFSFNLYKLRVLVTSSVGIPTWKSLDHY